MYSAAHTTPPRRGLLGLFLLACVAASCARDEASLTGSLGDFYDLRHDAVRARLYPSELAIEYVRGNNEVPVRVTVMVGSELEPGTFDLLEEGNITGRSNDVDIPRYRGGELRLQDFEPADEARVRGEFEATFDTGKDVAGLSGKFDTALEVVDTVGGYEVDAEFPDVQQFR